MQFKHPMLPVRNPVSHLVPELHAPPRYKQSRWWRSRINRQHTLHPMIPNMVRTQPSATVTSSSAYTAGSRVTQPTMPAVSVIPSTAANMIVTPAKPLAQQSANPPQQRAEEESSSPNLSVKSSSDNSSCNIVSIPANDSINSNNDKGTNPTSSNGPRTGHDLFAILSPVKNQGSELSLSDLSLSIFDLSLPSTSSSMMANLFPDVVPSGSGTSAVLSPQEVDEKMGDVNLNDLSLSSILNSFEPFPSSIRQPIDPDVDMSVLSENTVDYIARFQDIADELRAQQYP
uniref:Uncharacterized protein n=1 Tax=Anopheles maculatus TaxID=74869 RepID=A0A182SJ71_9DIPT